jgi:hypothetical protein
MRFSKRKAVWRGVARSLSHPTHAPNERRFAVTTDDPPVDAQSKRSMKSTEAFFSSAQRDSSVCIEQMTILPRGSYKQTHWRRAPARRVRGGS